jgi:hypothetical protein
MSRFSFALRRIYRSWFVALAAALLTASPAFAGAPPVITISGTIDGSGVMTVNPTSVAWKNTQWGTPTALKVNGTAWNPSKQQTLDVAGPLLPENLTDYFVSTKNSGRDLANAEIVDGKLLIFFADTPDGGANYDVQVSFRRKPAPTNTPSATVHITAKIDGSDILRISTQGATWITKQWSGPANVQINQ